MVKSYPGGVPGNVNMRGRKHKVLSCGCCDCHDPRDKYRDIEARRDIADALIDTHLGAATQEPR